MLNNAKLFSHIMYTGIFLMSVLTILLSRSILLPSTTNGKCSGSLGLACIKNSSRQLSSDLKELGEVTSNTSTQQSAPL